MSARLILTAPAKLNLYLHVTGRRPDGYHLLESLVAFIGLADRLTLEEADAFALELTGPAAAGLGTGPGNLALAAARALARRVADARARPVRIGLDKHIPIAAGLGGGSADAAAVLAGLARLWGAGDEVLAETALGLGADVPVCLEARPRIMAGIGEVLGPAVTLPDAGVALINPGVRLATPEVFAAFDRLGDGPPARSRPGFDPAPADASALAARLSETGNDLTTAARALAPVVGAVLGALGAAPGCRLARMAGSGPTCFGLFDDGAAAEAARAAIVGAEPGWWGWAGGFTAGR
ncbi:MAG: 4-(cytidine 5'-diphospho)-2-C-methyl-D-erythritol kinase [Alphaproteobacteria bacterium]|nr:4-(cytidine 5'-diphospho)-2-C-methyl-D-erythritol kinase [Alphaproteobacteria bacterium]